MEGISDIKIVGIDESRPPRLRKEPYIDICFRLSHQAPGDWCELFSHQTTNLNPSVRLDKRQGTFIETYVRDMAEIAPALEQLKLAVAHCTTTYIERRQQQARDDAAAVSTQGDEGPQGQLNRIVAELNYD
ncbi:MAG: hypothetical protein HQL49_00910 [Gammaproteobacteria bacterium]|nr:hypothetical protein [Gammaproteobacteria bacterium]